MMEGVDKQQIVKVYYFWSVVSLVTAVIASFFGVKTWILCYYAGFGVVFAVVAFFFDWLHKKEQEQRRTK